MNDLLRDPLIRARLDTGTVEGMSLPAIYAALVEDRIAAFPALRPHQRHGWHAFLAQLAVVALHRAGHRTPPTEAEPWRVLLRSLTTEWEGDEPWHLVVENPTQPAFMQPPAPDGLEAYRKRKETSDDLDLLVTSKNHDLKQHIADGGRPEDWIMALVNLQTMAGFAGAGNYGIARMNGGFSSRPCLGLAPSGGGPGAHIFFDVDRMLQHRNQLLEDFEKYYESQGGLALLWTEPWDGKSALRLQDLDPYFLEVCRRVRLVSESGRVIARTAPSTTARVAAKTANGNLGDFWTPIRREDAAALSVSFVGFRYDRLADLILQDRKLFKLPAAMKTPAGDGNSSARWKLVARGMASGQGKTDGYHERTGVTLRGRTARALLGGDTGLTLAKISEDLVKEIAEVQQALRFGVEVAAVGGKEASEITKADRKRAYERAKPFVRRLDGIADAWFFSELQDRYLATDVERPAIRLQFARNLLKTARKLLDEAVEAVPGSAIHRYRARARAFRSFEGHLRRSGSQFGDQPEILGQKEETP